MSLNAFGVLDAFVSVVRLLLGVAVVGLAVPAWWSWRSADTVERRRFFEDRSYLLFLLAIVLLVLNVASWPLFYLLLQSYVAPMGVMCIYGVTRFGSGTLGPSHYLPTILAWLEALKPFVIFLTGGWFVLYLLNRSTRTAPLMPRVLFTLALLGAVAVVDSSLEATYLAIPKTEEYEPSGCCMAAFDAEERVSSRLPTALVGSDYRPWVWGLFYGGVGVMGLALGGYLLRPSWRSSCLRLLPLAVGGGLLLVIGLVFLVEIASPKLLGLPNHHCPYDLVPDVPQSIPAIVLFVLGSFAAWWACVTSWFGRCHETLPFLARLMRTMLALSLVAYLGSVGMLSAEMWSSSSASRSPASQSEMADRCALDGVAINPIYRVRVLNADGTDHPFCSIACAEVWLKKQSSHPRAIMVTDETTGNEIPASSAVFVRSLVVTTSTTGNRIHAFKTEADANRHADAAGGQVLTGIDRPFADVSQANHSRAAARK